MKMPADFSLLHPFYSKCELTCTVAGRRIHMIRTSMWTDDSSVTLYEWKSSYGGRHAFILELFARRDHVTVRAGIIWSLPDPTHPSKT